MEENTRTNRNRNKNQNMATHASKQDADILIYKDR